MVTSLALHSRPSAAARPRRSALLASLGVLAPLVAFAPQSSAQPRPGPRAVGSSQPASSSPAGATAAPSPSPLPPPSAQPAAGPSAGASTGQPPTAPRAEQAVAAPRLHHAPPSVAAGNRPLSIEASIEHPELVKRAWVVYQSGDRPLGEAPFRRAATGPYVAEIPETEVRPPSVRYAIELETVDGERVAVFASREAMHTVEVPGDLMDARERATLARLGGRRSVVTVSGEYVQFGSTEAQVCPGTPVNGKCGSALSPESITDRYWRIEAGYTYRMLGHVAEFGVRGGVVRGQSVVENETNRDKYKVGLNYGAPTVRLRALDWLHVEGEFLTSVTEVGFSVGGGAAVLFGDPYGSKLTLGFESIQVFGTRGYSRIDLVASPRLLISPIVEVTDMPHSSKTGVRLLTEVRFDLLDGVFVSLRGGYQARDSASGGPSGGAIVSYSF